MASKTPSPRSARARIGTASALALALVATSACNLVLGDFQAAGDDAGTGAAGVLSEDGATPNDANAPIADDANPSTDAASSADASSVSVDAAHDDDATAPLDAGTDSSSHVDAAQDSSLGADSGAHDAGAHDASVHDAGSDAAHVADSAPPVDASHDDATVPVDSGSTSDAGTVYGDLTNAGAWSLHDLGALLGNTNAGYAASAFDGTYLYLIPDDQGSTGSLVARYDTRLPFDATASWTTFDVRALAGAPAGFLGAAYDGRYLYLVPGTYSNTPQGVAVRYDTKASFSAPSSWSAFDISSIDTHAKGFAGGVVVNPSGVAGAGIIYFIPSNDTPQGSGQTVTSLLAVFDPSKGTFTDAAAWSTLDTGPITSALIGSTGGMFAGGAFDGRWVYFFPTYRIGIRHDTTALLDAGWQAVDTVAIPVTPAASYATGFHGGVSDGTFLYMSPCWGTGGAAPTSTVLRFNVHADFSNVASYQTFDVSQVGKKGYCGAAFDGRYVYFAPLTDGAYFGEVVRYDTTTAFTAPSSWTAFDLATKDPGAVGYLGTAFDGRYVYMIPYATRSIARFDAKTPPSVPASVPGSLF